MSAVQEVNEQSWESEVLNSDVPVLVDFWAPWCGPCRALSPTVDSIAQEYAGKLKVVKCNTEAAGPVATKYGVMSIHALMVFKGGKVVEQMLGARPKPQITQKLDAVLG